MGESDRCGRLGEGLQSGVLSEGSPTTSKEMMVLPTWLENPKVLFAVSGKKTFGPNSSFKYMLFISSWKKKHFHYKVNIIKLAIYSPRKERKFLMESPVLLLPPPGRTLLLSVALSTWRC